MSTRSRIVCATVFALALASVALAQPQPTPASDAEVKKLLVLMDKDGNGKVSRAESMDFMAAEFDRLDVNRDGVLDVRELRGLRVQGASHPGGSGSR